MIHQTNYCVSLRTVSFKARSLTHKKDSPVPQNITLESTSYSLDQFNRFLDEKEEALLESSVDMTLVFTEEELNNLLTNTALKDVTPITNFFLSLGLSRISQKNYFLTFCTTLSPAHIRALETSLKKDLEILTWQKTSTHLNSPSDCTIAIKAEIVKPISTKEILKCLIKTVIGFKYLNYLEYKHRFALKLLEQPDCSILDILEF